MILNFPVLYRYIIQVRVEFYCLVGCCSVFVLQLFKGYNVGWFLVVSFFSSFFFFNFFSIVVAIFELVHDVDAIYHLP